MPHKKRLSIGAFVLVLGILAFVAVRSGIAKTKPTYDDAEGYLVLSKLLDRDSSPGTGRVIAISPTTAADADVLSHLDCGRVPKGFQTAIKNFHEMNKDGWALANRFSMDAEYTLSIGPDKNLPPPAAGEPAFLSTTPQIIYVVSAVGFDESKTRAVAYVSAFCGEMCAGGGYYFLLKEKQGWKEVTGSPACEWMSRNQASQALLVPA